MQKLGEAVFIPAGCPHQVRNLKVIFNEISVLLTNFFLSLYFNFITDLDSRAQR